jgi:DNA-binding LacI/PurR family transcriptional regulator
VVPDQLPRRGTLAQVARLAGVSVMTASYTYSRPGRVSPTTRQRVLQAAEQLGYPGPDPSARSLRRGSTRTLGLILGERLTYAFEDPQAVAFLSGVAQVCAERGYGLTLLPITGSAEDGARVRAAAVDAFVVWTTADDDPVVEAIRATQRPVVVHGGPALAGVTLVSIDNRAAARAIATLAFASSQSPAVMSFPLDRRRASFIATGVEPAEALFPVTRQRLEGYRDAAQDLGIPWTNVVVGVCATNSATEAEALADGMLADGVSIDAIAAMSDQQALGVLRACKRHGRAVPADLSVTGWDDSVVAVEWGLTTVAQSLREQGVACARAVLGGGPGPSADAWSIVRRQSTRS